MQERSRLDVNESGDSAPSKRRPSVNLRKKKGRVQRWQPQLAVPASRGQANGFLKQRQKYQLFRFRSDPALDPPTRRNCAADCEQSFLDRASAGVRLIEAGEFCRFIALRS